MTAKINIHATIESLGSPVLHYPPSYSLDMDSCAERDGARRGDGAPFDGARAAGGDSLRVLAAALRASAIGRHCFRARGAGEQ